LNAERLNAIAAAIQDDLATTDVPTLLRQLASELNLAVEEPQVPSHAQAVAAYRGQLNSQLAASRTNEFSDAWRLTVEELGIADLLGNTLRDRIESIFLRNEITLPVAAAEIAEISARLDSTVALLEKVTQGLTGLGVGSEELAPGQFEIGFLIPRPAVDNELEQLGKEFVKLDQILGPFLELTGENRPDLELRSISSSGFQVFLDAYADLALTMSRVVESLLASYERIRGMRKTAEEMDAQGTPPEVIDQYTAFANDRMALDIDALAGQLIDEAGDRVPEGRRAELRLDVRHSLRQLADRIDEEYSIEVRAFVLPAEAETEGTEALPEGVTDEQARAAIQITARQPRMRTMNLTGRRILELAAADEDREAADGADEAEGPTSS